MKSICLNAIPGLAEAIAKAKSEQFKVRENSLLGFSSDICGFKVRNLTVRDYVLLDRYCSPFINRTVPTMEDLAFFLWVLSPVFGLWGYGVGWRQHFPTVRIFLAYLHGRKVRKAFGKNIPETSEPAVVACFDYINKVFFDSPPSLGTGGESCICYLVGWFDALQSEYHISSESIWEMGLAELFQRLKAISHRRNPDQPNFNPNTDAVKAWVLRGLRSKQFTMEELAKGSVKLPDTFERN